MDACALTAAVTAIANTLASGLSAKELRLMRTVIAQLDATLCTIAARQELAAREKGEKED